MVIFLLILWMVNFISFKQLLVIYFFLFLSWLYNLWSNDKEIHVEFNGRGDDDDN